MRTLLILIGAALLAGCSVRTPSASVSVGTGWGYHGGYYYDDYYDHDHYYRDDYHRGGRRGGYFCPPGQAKKGNC